MSVSYCMVNLKPITTACHLYGQSFTALLPFSLVFAILLGLMHLPLFQNWGIFLGVLTLPVFIGWIMVLHAAQQGKPYSLLQIVDAILDKFISLMGVFFSMLLIPSIILCGGIIVGLLLESKKVDPTAILFFRIFIGLSLFTALISKSMAPLLIFTESLDPNSALEKSETLVHPHFVKTFFYMLYAIVFFGLLLTLAHWLPWLIPSLKTLPSIILNLCSAALAAVVGPWSIALWLAQLSDLQASSSSPP